MKYISYTVFMSCENLWHMDSICGLLSHIFSREFPLKLVVKHMPTAAADTTDKWPW